MRVPVAVEQPLEGKASEVVRRRLSPSGGAAAAIRLVQ